jgi:hypothetical protein
MSNVLSLSVSYEQRVFIFFSTTRKFIQPEFTEDLQHSMALKSTVFEASNINLNSSTAGAKTYAMIRGPEDSRLNISTPNYCMPAEGTVFFGVFAGRAPGRVARNRLGSFAQFAGNEKFSSPLSPTPVDRRPTADEGHKIRRAFLRPGSHAANPFSPYYHR